MEADKKHVEIMLKEWDMKQAKAVNTPMIKEERERINEGEELKEDGVEFESLVSVERRLAFIYLQGFFDFARPEAWFLSEDADVLQAHTMACVGDVL